MGSMGGGGEGNGENRNGDAERGFILGGRDRKGLRL